MNKLANFAFLVAVAVAAIVTQHYFTSPRRVVDPAKPPSLEGRIISIEPAPADRSKQTRLRRAGVKLTSGETVPASVPGGCLVFPGQLTRVAKYGEGAGSTYMITENGRDDS